MLIGGGARAEVDHELTAAMAALGAPAWKRDLVYAAVRAGGGSSWGM